jgi:1-deoxy-D-xylulose-5-phosphate reductoisomerase
MIEFADGSIKAQLSVPDMRLPIQYALFYPKRVNNEDLPRMSFDKPLEMTFAAVDYAAFPCLKLAIEAGKRGGTYPAVLCAADEIAVELFLQSCLRFADIERIIERTLSEHDSIMNPSLEEIILIDGWARATALEFARKETTCY